MMTSIPPVPVYKAIASTLDALQRCEKTGNVDWVDRHRSTIEALVEHHMPSGAGWDCATKLDFAESTPDRLVFYGAYHHMTGDGMYDGWTEHRIIVRPSLAFDFSIQVTGRNRNDIKEYLIERFGDALLEFAALEGRA
jgi:hypothetical protein